MDWVTIVWATIAGSGLTLALLSVMVWAGRRQCWPHFWFALASLSVVAISAAEYLTMHAASPASYLSAQRWGHVPVFLYLVSLLWFTHTYLDAGVRWLAWLIVALRGLVLWINFAGAGSVNFTEITELVPYEMFGQIVQVPVGVQNPWSPFASLTAMLAALFILHAAGTAWRRNGYRDRRRAIAIGVGLPVCITMAGTLAALMHAGVLRIPYFISPAFMLVILVMAFELSRELIHSAQSSDELRHNQARLKFAADAAQVGFWEWHDKAQELWSTEYFRHLLGFAESEAVTFDNWLAKVHRDDRSAAQLAFAESMTQGVHFRIKHRLDPADCGSRWIAVEGQAEFNHGGNPTVVRGIVQDVTAQHVSDLERDLLRWELAHASRVSTMGQLASSMAHELNQPLGAILRNAEAAAVLLEAESPDLQELREITEDIRRDDLRAGAVISRLRALLERHTLETNRVEVTDLVDDVMALLRTEAIARGVRLAIELDHGDAAVRGDPVHLQQVLLNLVMNALDAASRGKGDRFVLVQCRLRKDRMLEVSVADSGPGVSTDEADRIFEPFYTTKSSGMGLGLSICRTIVEAHDGTIWLEGGAESGAVFRFTLPALSGRAAT